MSTKRYLAMDFGAESGRVVVGSLDGGKLAMEEIHRFPNEPVEVCDTLHWDVLSLYNNILKGLRRYVGQYGSEAAGIGVDTWAIDFGFLGDDGKLLQNPVCYRDKRTEGMVELAHSLMPDRELYNHTGIATLSIHTLFQLLALRQSDSPLLKMGRRYLMMPDLMAYFLCGSQVTERTNAITTQFYDPRQRGWSAPVFEAMGLPLAPMPELVDPGTILGDLGAGACGATGLTHAPVVAVCSHDTGSAVAAVPAEGDDWAFISSGTWSILGALSPQVVTTDHAFSSRIVNELTVDSLFLARNIMGLWLLQQSRAAWLRQGSEYSYAELVELARQAPEGGPVVYPDDLTFLAPPDMPQAIADYCRRTGQTPPDGVPATVRCILESLALSYRQALEQISTALGRKLGVVHIVGGGSQNALLCQFTADASGLPVLAGPVEATVAGNVMVQALACGDVSSPAEIRQVVRRSSDLAQYNPSGSAYWDARYETYAQNLRK